MLGKLPPLNTLRLFEAAGRHLNFKLAAEEHHVTPSAVSHGIRTLEDWLGTELFLRTRTGLILTEAGAAYLPSVRQALRGLAQATARVPGRTARGELSISVAPTFASRWLLPRLHRFTEKSPDVIVTIGTAMNQVDLPSNHADLAIRMSSTPRPGMAWLELAKIGLVPVCAPAMRRNVLVRNHAVDLTEFPLIHVTTASEDWDAWFEMAGICARNTKGDLKVDTIELALQAALQGLGVALGRTPLVNDELASGRLIEAAGPPRQSRTAYWLVGTELTFDRPEANLFRRWLIEELAHSDTDGHTSLDRTSNEQLSAGIAS
jgi:DNA-binding transcriptional LysR family regulator